MKNNITRILKLDKDIIAIDSTTISVRKELTKPIY